MLDALLGISLDFITPRYIVSDPYLSFNIDSASLFQDTAGGRLNFSDPILNDFAKQLCSSTPESATLRIGGSSADNLAFVSTAKGDDDGVAQYNQQILIDFDYWNSIITFADRSGCKIVWDLCALSFRNATDGSWNSTNAGILFNHMVSNNQSIYGWQLGNEPGHWKTRHPTSGPDGEQVGRDLISLHDLVAEKFSFTSTRIFGPDICGPASMTNASPCSTLQFFTDIISVAQPILSGVTVHHYGLLSAHKSPNNCHLSDFINPDIIFKHEAKYGIWRDQKNTVMGTKAETGAELILGETASAGSGGCVDLSNSFAAGFWWIHTLGEVASLQYDQIYRQNLVGWSGIGDASYYTLAGDPGWSGAYTQAGNAIPLHPAELIANPDFYTSLFWKRLMSPVVLNVFLDSGSAALLGISVHVHCAAQAMTGELPMGAVALSYANTRQSTVYLNGIRTTQSCEVVSLVPRIEYLLTCSSDDLMSRLVYLNGASDPLSSKSPMVGRRVTTETVLALPPLSYGFIVLPNSQAQACMINTPEAT